MVVCVHWGDDRAGREGYKRFTSYRLAKRFAHAKRRELRLPFPDSRDGKFKSVLRAQNLELFQDAYVILWEHV